MKTQKAKFKKGLKVNKHKIKLKRLKELLNNQSQEKQSKYKMTKGQSLTLRDKMMMHLRASRFRFINETLYNSESTQSRQYFKEDPDAFKAYHDGYKQQLEQWPINPLDIIISSIKKMYAILYYNIYIIVYNKYNNICNISNIIKYKI
jgi:ribosomal RNA-processing protein 8